MRVYCGMAGVVCFTVGRGMGVNVHLLVRRNQWVWGRRDDLYDGHLLHYFGLGPLLLVCW